jgi:hypothetical protein
VNDKTVIKVQNGAGWEGEIETTFLKPAVRNTKECSSIFLPPEAITQYLFVCSKTKAVLQGTKALAYIEWGEQATITVRQGVAMGETLIGYQNVTSLKGRKQWWDLNLPKPKPLHFGYMIDQISPMITAEAYFSDNFHDLLMEEEFSIALNCSIFHLVQNIYGRANFGGGLMKIQTFELKQMELPNVPFDGYKPLLQALQKGSIFEEYGLNPNHPFAQQTPNPTPARKAVDDIIFNALGLSQLERDEVYRAVCQLVWERTSKAKNKGA